MLSFNNDFEIQKAPEQQQSGGATTDAKDSINMTITDSIEVTDYEGE